MLVRSQKQAIALLGPVLLLICLLVVFCNDRWIELAPESHRTASLGPEAAIPENSDQVAAALPGLSTPGAATATVMPDRQLDESSTSAETFVAPPTHREIFSLSTPDRKYFSIAFGEHKALNPSILPHPWLGDTWVIVAQQQRNDVPNTIWFAELVCDAAFREDGTLACLRPPMNLPIAVTSGDKCEGALAHFAFNVGPHDARVFYGPKLPYAIYGSNSALTCFGQWMQDFRMLVDWEFEVFGLSPFREATELHRPDAYRPIEKNWFVFWDSADQMYVHYDVVPRRVFAKLEPDGTVGPDLAGFAAPNDEACIGKYLPALPPDAPESIHQATNSLCITLCPRSDPACVPNESNTFLLTVIHHKRFYSFHSTYEPYVMLFQHSAPFALHGISKRPLWIHGRRTWIPESSHRIETYDRAPGDDAASSADRTQLFYVTSLSWKDQSRKYHGYRDDLLFLAFGIDDRETGGIEIVAEDLLEEIGLCFGL